MPGYLPDLPEPARRWIRFGALAAALALVCYAVYALRGVFTPLLAGLAIAYVLSPVVSWVEQRTRASRLSVVIVAFTLLVLAVAGGGAWLALLTTRQAQALYQNWPSYADRLASAVSEIELRWGLLVDPDPADGGGLNPTSQETLKPPAANATMRELTPLGRAVRELVTDFVTLRGAAWTQAALAWLLGALSNLFAVISLVLLLPLYTFYFLWHFDDLVRAVREHLPAAQRDAILHVCGTIDRAVSNFFRGRLMVCLAVGVLTGVGWTLIGVPYGLPLGLLAGAFNMVPFLSVLALPPALLFSYLGAVDAGQAWLWPVLGCMIVYMVVQGLESLLLSPYIEGTTSGLHPLVIVVALLIGAELAGLIGMLLAIPVASTLKVLAQEWVLPEVRRLAGRPAT